MYFTGKPCKYGHISERYTSNCFCVECCRKYAEDHKKELKEYNHAYREKNKESLRKKKSERLEKNKEIIYKKAKERRQKPEEREKDRIRAKKYREKNKERCREQKSEYRNKNKDRINRYIRNWYKNLSEEKKLKIKEKRKKWATGNREKINNYNHKRRSSKINRTPKWFCEFDEFVVQEATELCHMREFYTNIKWEVDHMYPLVGEEISGLHIGINIQVIPRTLNRQKSNNLKYFEPFSFIEGL